MREMTEKERLIRNLHDAGCTPDTIDRYLELHRTGRQQELLRLLSRHRASLLDRLHVSQQMLDCLDYLMYSLKK